MNSRLRTGAIAALICLAGAGVAYGLPQALAPEEPPRVAPIDLDVPEQRGAESKLRRRASPRRGRESAAPRVPAPAPRRSVPRPTAPPAPAPAPPPAADNDDGGDDDDAGEGGDD